MAKFFKVKMFNLEEINFQSFLKYSLFLSRTVCLHFAPLEKSSSFRKKFKYYLLHVYVRFVLIFMLWGVVSFLIKVYVTNANLAADFMAIPNATTSFVIFSKFALTVYNRKAIWIIIQELESVYKSQNKDFVNDKVKKDLQNYFLVCKIYSAILLSSCIQMLQNIFPFLIYGKVELPVDYWYPFDAHRQENFPYAFGWSLYVGTLYSLTLLASDLLLLAFINVLVVEFKVLKININKLKFIADDEKKEQLKTLIIHHNKLLTLSKKLQDIYGPTYLISFVMSSLIMCFVAFQLSTGSVTENEHYLFFVAYMFMICGQVFLQCFSGQKLIDSSIDVADAAFDSGWDEIDDNKLKKHFVIVIMRAQLRNGLTAMKFVEVSLEVFIKVCHYLLNFH